jgi:hypothetical protein
LPRRPSLTVLSGPIEPIDPIDPIDLNDPEQGA